MAYVQSRRVDVGGLLSGTFSELARIPRALAIYLGVLFAAALIADLDERAMAIIATLASIAYFPGQYYLYRAALADSGLMVQSNLKVFGFAAIGLILIWPIMIGLNFFYIPGLLLAAKWVMTPSFYVAENRTFYDSMSDSWSASRDNLLHLSLAFGIIVIGWGVGFALVAALSTSFSVADLIGREPASGLGALAWTYMHFLPIMLMGLSVTAYRSLADADTSLVEVFE